MRFRTVEVRKVRVGDYIYNSQAAHPSQRWCRVRRIEPIEVPRSFDARDGSYHGIELTISGWSTIKHPREGIAIRRY